MSLFDSAILGIVEGLTEFLPVSSTGHLILASYLLQIPNTEFLKSFEIAIQMGAILAVIVLYWRSFLNMEILKRVLVGFIPTAIVGLVLYKFIKAYLIGNEYVVIAALFIGGIILIIFEKSHVEKDTAVLDISKISYRQAMGIGLFQSIAVMPGVSRSAATIIGGLFLGLSRKAVVEYSFLLAVPTLGAATVLDLLKSYSLFSPSLAVPLLVGFITAFIVAFLVIQYFMKFIRTKTFIPFGIYRIIIAVIFLLIII